MISLLLMFLNLNVFAGPHCGPLTFSGLHSTQQFSATLAQSTQPQSPGRLICEELQRREKGQPAKFKPLCSVFWKDYKTAPFEEILKSNPESLNKYSDQVKNFSVKEMADKGIHLASEDEVKKIVQMFDIQKTSLAPKCCGSDQKCLKAFEKIGLRFCQSPSNPAVPDPCSTQGDGVFDMTEEEALISWVNMFRDIPNEDYGKTAYIKEKKWEHLLKQKGNVTGGFVSLSKYHKADSARLRYLIPHELGHACSHIKRQIAALKGRPNGTNRFQPLSMLCKINHQGLTNFEVLEHLETPAAQKKIRKCMENRIDSEVKNVNDKGYAPNGCYGLKVEEAAADVFVGLAAKNAGGPTTEIYCAMYPDPTHVGGFSSVECLVENSSRYGKMLKQELKCAQ